MKVIFEPFFFLLPFSCWEEEDLLTKFLAYITTFYFLLHIFLTLSLWYKMDFLKSPLKDFSLEDGRSESQCTNCKSRPSLQTMSKWRKPNEEILPEKTIFWVCPIKLHSACQLTIFTRKNNREINCTLINHKLRPRGKFSNSQWTFLHSVFKTRHGYSVLNHLRNLNLN